VQALKLDDPESVANFVDPSLEGEYEMADAITLLELSQHCTHIATARRPWMEDVLAVLREQFSEDVAGAPIASGGKHSESGGDTEGAKRSVHNGGVAAGSDDGENSSKSFSRRSVNGVPDDSVSFDIKWRDIKVPIKGLSREYQFDVKAGEGDGADDSLSFATPHSGLLTLNDSSTNYNRPFEGLGSSELLSDNNMRSFPWAHCFRSKEENRSDTSMDQSDEQVSGFHFPVVIPDVSGSSANQLRLPEQEVEMEQLRQDQINMGSDWEGEGTRWLASHASRHNSYHSHHHTVYMGEG
ncbi:hypothetical protein CBR_g55237, partial [Chara braunii]